MAKLKKTFAIKDVVYDRLQDRIERADGIEREKQEIGERLISLMTPAEDRPKLIESGLMLTCEFLSVINEIDFLRKTLELQ